MWYEVTDLTIVVLVDKISRELSRELYPGTGIEKLHIAIRIKQHLVTYYSDKIM